MKPCMDTGTLRAYLDHECDPATQQAVAAHLEQCATCRAAATALAAQAVQIAALLPAAPVPPPDLALRQMQATIAHDLEPDQVRTPTRRTSPMNRSFTPMRRIAAAAVAVLMLTGLLLLPPVQALADQLLQIFRVQQVLFVPISDERIAELKNLEFEKDALFVSPPEVTNNPAEPAPVADAAAAAALAGYPVREPSSFPGDVSATEMAVTDRTEFAFQVDADGVRELLTVLNITDVTVPETLGASPITGSMRPTVLATYTGDEFSVTLAQGRSPELSLPDGVDLQQMGVVMLRVLGMEPNQAKALAATIDWSSTLLFPFPADIQNLQQVTVNGQPGLLVTADRETARRGYHLYWQDGDSFYTLHTEGRIGRDAVLELAASVR